MISLEWHLFKCQSCIFFKEDFLGSSANLSRRLLQPFQLTRNYIAIWQVFKGWQSQNVMWLNMTFQGRYWGLYRGFRDTGYLPFYFQGYMILTILLSGVQYLGYFQGYWIIRKISFGGICQFITDTCLFTSRDMGYLVPPIQASILIGNSSASSSETIGYNIPR